MPPPHLAPHTLPAHGLERHTSPLNAHSPLLLHACNTVGFNVNYRACGAAPSKRANAHCPVAEHACRNCNVWSSPVVLFCVCIVCVCVIFFYLFIFFLPVSWLKLNVTFKSIHGRQKTKEMLSQNIQTIAHLRYFWHWMILNSIQATWSI